MAEAPETPEKPAKERDYGWARWTGAGIEFGVAVLLFFLLGSWLDDRWGTHPWMRVAGSLLGVVVGTYLLVKPALQSIRDDRDIADGPGGPSSRN